AFFLRLASLIARRKIDHDFDAEMESHLAMHVQDNLRAGMSAQGAKREALMKLGGIEQTKELYPERSTLPWLETLLQDLRFGARSLRKNPGFTVIAILTMALGIGANTAIFSVVNSVLLGKLPYKNSRDLVLVWESDTTRGKLRNVVSPPDFTDWQHQN